MKPNEFMRPNRAFLYRSIEAMIDAARIYRSCLTCSHFTEATEGCAKAGGGRPPARIIAAGCDQWDEKTPF